MDKARMLKIKGTFLFLFLLAGCDSKWDIPEALPETLPSIVHVEAYQDLEQNIGWGAIQCSLGKKKILRKQCHLHLALDEQKRVVLTIWNKDRGFQKFYAAKPGRSFEKRAGMNILHYAEVDTEFVDLYYGSSTYRIPSRLK